MAGKYDYSQRYLNAFVEIEQALQKIVGNTRYKPFYQLVDAAANIDPFVREIAIELKEYGDLRNAIVHERINEQPIAEPHPEVVTRLERIRDLLNTPPTVADGFLRPVVTCELNDYLEVALTKMLDNSFSKLPVYQGKRFVGLITAEAVTYWLADRSKHGTISSKERVAAVMRYLPRTDSYRFVDQNCSLLDVLRIFDDYSHSGRRIQAILISDDGSESGKLLGIITIFDLPRIYHIIEGK